MKYIHQVQRLTAAFGLALTLASSGVQAVDASLPQANPGKQKVVFQVSADDPTIWNLALNNAKNVQQELGAQNVEVEIVAYGPGIGMLKFDSVVSSRVGEAVGGGIKIVACEITMKAQKLTKDDMLASIDFVPSGVVELMKKQKEGYAYIRP